MSETVLVVDLATGESSTLAEATLQQVGLQERRDLQRWITRHPDLVGEGLLLITSEFDRWELREQRVDDRLDVLFLDSEGCLVVAELKRDRASDTTDLQALKYAAFCSTLTVDDVVEEFVRFHAADETAGRDAVLSHAPHIEEEGLGGTKIRLVAGDFGPSVTSVVLWLRDFGLDIGCVQVTARLLDGERATITARQLLPLPVAEDYTVRRRRREQEQDERVRSSRGSSSIQVLANAGLLEAGTELRLGLDAITSSWRPAVEHLLEAQPSAGVAEWTGDLSARSIRWRLDGELYSLTGLTKTVLLMAGVEPPEALPGPDYWLLPDGRPMYKASVELRRETRTWDVESFMEALRQHAGEEAVPAAERLHAWGEQRGFRIAWGKGRVDGSFQPVLDLGERSYYPICVYSYGRVEIQFQYLNQPPFDEESARSELLDRLNALPGISFDQSALTRRPSISLKDLSASPALAEGLEATLDWVMDEARKANP